MVLQRRVATADFVTELTRVVAATARRRCSVTAGGAGSRWWVVVRQDLLVMLQLLYSGEASLADVADLVALLVGGHIARMRDEVTSIQIHLPR